jgi:hypothetical protein
MPGKEYIPVPVMKTMLVLPTMDARAARVCNQYVRRHDCATGA